jgi:putative ABC transport system substrate-binding protein
MRSDQLTRHEILKLLVGAVASLALPVAALAQQATRVRRIGFVGATTVDGLPGRLEAFRAGLRELGYHEGRNVVIEQRWADGRYERLPALFDELVRRDVEVLVTHGTPATRAAKRATATIPIVMATSGDAEASGLVASLGRPGGNVTGLTFFNPELAAKRFELLKEILPGLTNVGLLLNTANPVNEQIVPAIKLTAQALGLDVHLFGVRAVAELEGALAAMAARPVGAVVAIDDAVLIDHAPMVAKLALQQRLPSSGWPDYALAGGLIAFGVNFPDLFRRAATFVDKILKGAKPADLPVERATKFETIVNLKTARALGLDVPGSILSRADEVVE